ncbi:MobA/MobL family protein [Mesorhizobium sp. M1060]|nr:MULTISPECIES: MobA/MobL family protein [unclassified Mesorhizobium]ESZ02740.1 hypothetical protein X736_29630 [Mesorhizobium sp. L2C089B000]WJI50606.1 MobA/MobL family protein [Mesorhizobium sp. C089B]
MAIYHLHVKVIGRKAGSSAVASAAYRSASRLRDERIERLPQDAPEAWRDRERLWNDVETFEVRKDAQLAREVEFALPRELSQPQGIELARDFVQVEFVSQGMDRLGTLASANPQSAPATIAVPAFAPPATLAVRSMPGDIASGEARGAKPACRLGLLDTLGHRHCARSRD